MAQDDRPPKVWLLYRQHDRVAQGVDDPGMDLEGFPSIGDAVQEITTRIQSGYGTTRYLHPDRADQEPERDWVDNDRAKAYAAVWLAQNYPPEDMPPGWQPDATSEPDERWTLGPRGGIHRDRY